MKEIGCVDVSSRAHENWYDMYYITRNGFDYFSFQSYINPGYEKRNEKKGGGGH